MIDHHAISERSQNMVTRVLVVDDDKKIYQFIDEILSTSYQVLYARNAEEAYPILVDCDIGIMICSEYLSGENGLIFMGRMNKEFLKMQPVLMSEGVTEDLLAFAINDVGFLKYLKKPLIKSKLLDAVSGANDHYLQAVANETLQKNYKAIVEETQRLPYIAHRVKEATTVILSNIGSSAIAVFVTMLFMFAIIAILGIVVVLVIYTLKSLFGIDIFSDFHLSDLIW